MLVNTNLPARLAAFKKLVEEEGTHTSLEELATALVEMLEAELICEGLLDANS